MTDIHLSPRELQVLYGIACGHTLELIAFRLGISRRTAKNYADSVRLKLGAQTNAAAVANAIGMRLICVFEFEGEVAVAVTSSG